MKKGSNSSMRSYSSPSRRALRCVRRAIDCGETKVIAHLLLFIVALAAPCVALAADVLGTITILEGQALIYRGTGRLHAAEGVRLESGDIVETAASTVVQIEFNERASTDLGPETRVMVGSADRRSPPERTIYVMQGWVKMVGPKGAKAGDPADSSLELRSANFENALTTATYVLRQAGSKVEVFVEGGELRMTERQPGGAAIGTIALAAGQFYQRSLPGRGAPAPAAAQAFIASLPTAFRDTLPARAERFRNREVQPKEAPVFAYADVEPWLKAEPPLRKPLMQRWRSKAQEPAFRSALVAQLRAHPEWAPILFPERYKPKPPPARKPPGATPTSPPATAAETAASPANAPAVAAQSPDAPASAPAQ
jgi:hypothetical protein